MLLNVRIDFVSFVMIFPSAHLMRRVFVFPPSHYDNARGAPQIRPTFHSHDSTFDKVEQ